MERRIEFMALADLRPAPTNAKAHAGGAIARSISTFGFVEPIVLDDRTGRVVVGHGRVADLEERREQGQAPPDGVTEDWLVPVVRGWASADDAEAEAYGVAANRLIESGGWNVMELSSLLGQIEDAASSLLAATGFTPDDLDDLVAQAGQGVLTTQPFLGGYAETDEEAAARIPREAGTRESKGLHDVVLPFKVSEWTEVRGLIESLRRRWKCTPGEAVVRAMKLAR